MLFAIVIAAVLASAAAITLARRTLSSLLAGVALHLARPYAPGEQVRGFDPAAGQVAEAEVIKLGAVRTTLGTSDGLLVVPNTHMLRAAPETTDAA